MTRMETVHHKKVMHPERFVTLSNTISIFRAGLAAPIIISLHRDRMLAASAFIFLAVISDVLDGYFARKFNSVTVLGKALDPAADKICILSVILFLVIKDKIPLSFFVIIGIRDFLLGVLHLYLVNVKSIVTGANKAGKLSTVLIAAALFTYIYDLTAMQTPFVYAAFLAMALSFLQYFIIFVKNFGK